MADRPLFGNPMLAKAEDWGARFGAERSDTMTVTGVTVKTTFLLLVTLGSAWYTWTEFFQAVGKLDYSQLQQVSFTQAEKDPAAPKTNVEKEVEKILAKPEFARINSLTIGGILVGLVVGLICCFSEGACVYLSPIYAACEGLAIGGISASYELQLGGIAMQAVAITAGLMVTMLVLFQTGIVKATSGFVRFILTVMLGILLIYLLDIGLSVFGREGLSLVHSTGWVGIGFSLLVIGIATLSFTVDFDNVQSGVEAGAPKRLEWYCAFGLLVGLLWVYLEVLRLLVKLKSSNNN